MKVNKGKTLNTPMQSFSLVSKGLQRIADGYVDEKIITVRRLLREGKNCQEIAEALGAERQSVRRYIISNGLPLPVAAPSRKDFDRSWYGEAIALRGKMKIREIAGHLGRSHAAIASLFSRVDNGLLDPSEIGRAA